jgi:hypothetical protein
MSLINDALKRARQAQTQAPPSVSPGPQLRPVEPRAQSVRKGGLILPLFIAGIVALALFLLWNQFRGTSKVETTSIVPMKENRTAHPAPNLRPDPEKVRASTALPPPVSVVPKPNPPESVQGPATGSQTETNLPVPATTSKPSPSENVTPSEKPAVPAATPLKLEGILFHPANPAAMIAGKTLFINDKLGDWRVVAITRDSATLSNAGHTNVLTLQQ